MARKKEKKAEVPAVPPGAEDPAAEGLDGLTFQEEGEESIPGGVAHLRAVPDEPPIHDPAWTPYVLSRLREDEKTADGKPRVTGLRRVGAELLGDVLENSSEVVQAPEPGNGRWATVRAKLVILWTKGLSGDEGSAVPRVFTGLADVHPGNTDEDFAVFPTSVAETRAEGRAWTRALHLVRVVTAEECGGPGRPVMPPAGGVMPSAGEVMPPAGENEVHHIRPEQKNFIEQKCKQLKIDLNSFLKLGKNKYSSLEEVPQTVAQSMVTLLGEWQRDTSRIPARVKMTEPEPGTGTETGKGA